MSDSAMLDVATGLDELDKVKSELEGVRGKLEMLRFSLWGLAELANGICIEPRALEAMGDIASDMCRDFDAVFKGFRPAEVEA